MFATVKTLVLVALFALVGSVSAMDMDMHGDAGEEWTREDDAYFLYGMIAHHEGAVKMAEMVRGKSSDADIERWASGIIALQEQEIALMRSIANRAGLTDSEGAGADMAEMMDAMMGHAFSPDRDANFVAGMIPHHAGAIDMALPALVGSQDPDIRQLARDIIAAQAAEIYEFRSWLDSHSPQQ